MKELEKILEEIKEATRQEDAPIYREDIEVDGYVRQSVIEDIIRKHMNDDWIPGESESRPQNKQLCVVIHKTGMKYPQIYQWRIAENNFSDTDMFVSYGLRNLEIEDVKYWKPLMIPRDMEEQILSEIEKWF